MDFIFNLLNEIHMDIEQEKSTSSRKGDCHNANLYTYISVTRILKEPGFCIL